MSSSRTLTHGQVGSRGRLSLARGLTNPLPGTTARVCFYYGILAFERFFAGDCQDRSLHSTALRALEAYRSQTAADFQWSAVEDRYEDLKQHH